MENKTKAERIAEIVGQLFIIQRHDGRLEPAYNTSKQQCYSAIIAIKKIVAEEIKSNNDRMIEKIEKLKNDFHHIAEIEISAIFPSITERRKEAQQ